MSERNSLVNKAITLLKTLFPSAVIRWLMLLMVAIVSLGFALTELLAVGLIGIVAGMLGSPLVLIGMVTIPTQMVALASNRTATSFPGLRNILLAVYWLISLVLSVTICWVWDLTQLNHFSLHMFLAVWLTTSLIFQASVWLCTLSQATHFVLFAVYLMLGDILGWLENFKSFYVVLFILLTWGLFASWWLNWRPAKYKANPFFVGTVKNAITPGEQKQSSWFYRGNAKSWIGSRLLGAQDTWQRRAKEVLAMPLLLAVWALPLVVIFPQFSGHLTLGVRTILFLLASGMGLLVLTNIYRFLPMVWLTGVGKREQLYLIVWRYFWRDIAAGLIAIFSLLLVLELFFGEWSGIKKWALLVALVLLHQCFVFFLVAWLYQKERLFFESFWIAVLIAQSWFACLLATGLVVGLPFDWQGISVNWLWLPELVLLLLLYLPVRNGFGKINLIRMV